MHISRVLTATLLCIAPALAGPLLLVVPNAQTNTPGNAPDVTSGSGSFHYQEVFGSGQFAGIPGSLLITQVAFRTVPGTGPSSLAFTSLDLFLSTTLYAPNTNGGATLLTNNYATNLGPDNTHVFSGPLTLASPGCAGPSVCPFDLLINLATPFLFNPAQGRLLADVQGAGSLNSTLDNVSFSFPPGGSVATLHSGGTVRTDGDIVQFG